MLYNVYATAMFIICLPLQLLYAVLVGPWLKLYGYRTRSEGSSWILTLLCAWVFCRDWLIFDSSYLYHSFRGQTSLKFYGLLFAFKVSKKLLTMLGQPILIALSRPKNVTVSNFLKVTISSFIYVSIHAFSIYL
jgi:hypothetical protein